MKTFIPAILLTIACCIPSEMDAFTIISSTTSMSKGRNALFHNTRPSSSLPSTFSSTNEEPSESNTKPTTTTTTPSKRRSFLQTCLVGTTTTALTTLTSTTKPLPSHALVKGNAPPPPKSKQSSTSSEERPKCRNVEECQEMAERLAAQQDEEMRANAIPAKVAPLGSRYRDEVDGTAAGAGGAVAKVGDVVDVRYKVLKLGKRSYDGLSGEGTVVFSRGYGLEDDETKPKDKTFQFQIGNVQIIPALNDAVPGMTVGTTRRISILPQMGWRKPGAACDGGPGGRGAGGELKTDYVVVPTATMVAEETCFDTTKLPFPNTYAQQRRMAQRFDQSLIIEVELVDIVAS